jgi:hypothetical protein
MKARIVAAPIVLPRAKPTDELRICVADRDGTLSLLRGADLKLERAWKLKGQLTAGPFLRGQRIGCIVDRRRLVWIDPVRDEILWQFAVPGEGIVGQPRLIGKSLLVADLSGKFIALDSETGRQQGGDYTLGANVAPVASPVAFGADQALVPLTDASVLLLPLKSFQEAHALAPKK